MHSTRNAPASLWPTRALAALSLSALVLQAGCGDNSGASARPASDQLEERGAGAALEKELSARVERILAASNEATVETTAILPNGARVPARETVPVQHRFDRQSWLTERSSLVETPGEVVQTWKPDDAPALLLVDNEGTILLGGRTVDIVAGDNTTSTLARFEPTVLQWNSDGTRVLVAGPERKAVYAWPEHSLETEFERGAITGFLQFAPAQDGYWTLADNLIFDASQPTRVFWNVNYFKSDPAQSLSLMQFRPMTKVGTLPTLGSAWAQPIDQYHIVPQTASLWELDRDMTLSRQLTDAGESVDAWPVADMHERLFFLRAPRFVDGLVGRASRGWMNDLSNDSPEMQITGEPTCGIAVSPDGNRLALLVMREGGITLLRCKTKEVLAQDLSGAGDARRSFERGVKAVCSDLAAALEACDPEGAPEITDDFAKQQPWPSMQTLNNMAKALVSALRHRFQLDLDGSIASLGALDDFLQEADGLLVEDHPTILAIAGYYVGVLSQTDGFVPLTEAWTPALGADVTAVTEGDEFTYTFHGFLYAARERIAGRLLLHETAVELLTEWSEPIVLAENFSSFSRNVWYVHELARVGFDFDSRPTEAFREVVVIASDNDTINSLALEAIKRAPDDALRLRAALNLAESNPASAAALIEAAKAVGVAGSRELQVELCRQAELLAPTNSEVLFDSATGHFDAWFLDEAEERYRRALQLDETGALEDLINDAIEQIEQFRVEGLDNQ